jgi:uncharacterized protein YggE
MNLRSHMLISLTAPLVALALVMAAPAACAQDRVEKAQRTLNVSGQGEVAARPDQAHVQIGVVTEGDTASAALRANSEAMTKVIATLREQGLENRDIQTSGFSVSPRYRQYPRGETGPPVIDGYTVSNMVTARVRDLDRLGGLLDRVVSDGANQLRGISFSIAETGDLMNEARKRAVADARARAEVLAAAAGVRLGEILTINDGGAHRPSPAPMYAMRAEAAMDVPMEAGEQTVQASVNIVYAIE